ncbi:MAG: chromate efflux transporter [Wenzhouxiangella sp.]|nr:MAG: chromate efflux transporter [Wenzhouxiangella sp.]
MSNTPDIPARDFLKLWWQVAILSFGGPAAQIGVMQRLIVDDKRWLRQDEFNHALNFCMLLPGPEAQQLATYIGWRLKGVPGGVLAGVLFVLPGALVMLGLSLLYVTVGQTGLVEGLLFGLKCAVLAIVAQALLGMAGKVLVGRAALAIAGSAFVAMFLFGLPFPLIILLAALAGWLVYAQPSGDTPSVPKVRAVPVKVSISVLVLWLSPLLLLLVFLGRDSVWTQIAGFFSLVSVLSFGGAYAVLAWVAQFAAETQGWIRAEEMLDGLGLAETTPGPLILVTQFVGFLATWRHASGMDPLLAGSLGGVLTTWVMFAPSFLWIFLLAPWVERLRSNMRVAAALRGITAAVVGVIAFLAGWFALRLLFSELREVSLFGLVLELPIWSSVDPAAVGVSLAAAILLFLFRLGLFSVVALSAMGGWILTL